MHVPQAAIALCTHFEGFYPEPYLCPAGYWTIGYGHLCDKTHKPITKEEAVAYLMEDLRTALKAVTSFTPSILDDEAKTAALTSWTFNLGAHSLARSTMRKRILEGNFEAAARELRHWNKARVNGKLTVLKGLTRRRDAEARLFLTGVLTFDASPHP